MEATVSYLLILTKIYQFKAKCSEKKSNGLCLGNISNNFALDSKEETGLKGSVIFFLLIIILLVLMMF